jgi:hypothetical protein
MQGLRSGMQVLGSLCVCVGCVFAFACDFAYAVRGISIA